MSEILRYVNKVYSAIDTGVVLLFEKINIVASKSISFLTQSAKGGVVALSEYFEKLSYDISNGLAESANITENLFSNISAILKDVPLVFWIPAAGVAAALFVIAVLIYKYRKSKIAVEAGREELPAVSTKPLYIRMAVVLLILGGAGAAAAVSYNIFTKESKKIDSRDNSIYSSIDNNKAGEKVNIEILDSNNSENKSFSSYQSLPSTEETEDDPVFDQELSLLRVEPKPKTIIEKKETVKEIINNYTTKEIVTQLSQDSLTLRDDLIVRDSAQIGGFLEVSGYTYSSGNFLVGMNPRTKKPRVKIDSSDGSITFDDTLQISHDNNNAYIQTLSGKGDIIIHPEGGDVFLNTNLKVTGGNAEIAASGKITSKELHLNHANTKDKLLVEQEDGTDVFSISTDTPKIVINGPIESGGDITTLGNLTVVGDIAVSGNQIYTGGSTFGGNLTVNADSSLNGNVTITGNVGIGTTAPTAYLHLKAGTATANTAPLKFTSGTLNTTAEAGAVEFLTDAYYGTITTGAARRTFAFLESPTFTGTVTIPTPFTLGATSVTTTGTQLNYLNAATGTTGTTSTNLVFSTSPTLITPALGTPTALVLTNATGLPAASVLAGTFGTGAYTMDTSLTVPTIIGGTGTTSDLSLQTTSGVGAAGADMHFLVGNNGATEAMTILNSGNVGMGTTSPNTKLHIFDNSGTDMGVRVDNGTAYADFEIQSNNVARLGTVSNHSVELITNNNSRFKVTSSGDVQITDGQTTITGGNVGIGTTAPTAYLHLKAGTATANTAPLKFTSGTLNTTAEAGAVEFLTDAYYGTITTGAARRTFAFLESPTFTGTVTIPTPFTLGAVSVTTTGTQLNYLNAATGTTGTTSTNLVFSTSPTLITPALGTPTALVLTNATGLPAASVLAGTFGTGAYTMDTSLTVPTIVGGTATTSDLNLKTTSGVGATGADMHFLVGNNGATEAMTILNNGNVGIGQTAPTAVLHLKAGTASTSTAPLKFTSGTLLTTAEAGAVEFLTDAYYGTITTGAARRTFAFLESPTFTGTVTIPTPFTLGAVSVTTTGTQLNYLNAATGTTGTTSTNLVFSTSPTLITPALGTPTALVLTNATGLPAASILAGTFGTGAYTMDTSLTVPTIVGGTATTSDLNLKTTSGIGATGADMHFLVGNNGATEAMTILNSGNVGIGQTAPTAYLHLKAGTATANTAPLKFTSGTLNTTAEAGAVEFLTDAYYGTITTGAARKTFAFLESPTFTGTVIIPTPFTLGAVSVTTTGTQLNYLNAATGTTGTTSTNLVFSTSPTLITPALGTPTALVLTNATGLPAASVLAGTFGTGAYTMDTSLTVPTIVGGTATTSDLNLKTTSGIGATGADMHFLVGNNGATEAMTILNSGNVGIGTTGPNAKLEIYGSDGVSIIESLRLNNANVAGKGTKIVFYQSGTPVEVGRISNYFDGSKWRMNLGSYTTPETLVITEAGNVGIGTTTPTAYLHLKAGTATASTAPLKFTSGVLNTTAEAGAVEFLTDAYYGTITTGAARKTFAFLESPTFTGTVTLPTPFTLGAVSVTTTGTQLNYLNAATGTTGTTSTNLVFSTSPTLITPALGTPSALVLTNATGLPAASVLAGTFGTGAYTMDTSLTVPTIIGGTATTSDLNLKTTSGVGATGADMHFLVGNNGATEAMTILNSGYVGIGTATPGYKFDVLSSGTNYTQAHFGMAADAGAYILSTQSDQAIIGGGANYDSGGWRAKFTSATTYGGYMVTSGDFAVTTDTGLTAGNTFTPSIRLLVNSSGNVGIGTTTPTSLLNLKGTLSSALTGTVSVTAATAAVTGVGTAFDTELAVGDSIKIGSEIFTVSAIASATALTLDSNHSAGASAVTAYRDPTLFAIDNGDAVNKLTVTRSGNVGIGTTGPLSPLHQVGGGASYTGEARFGGISTNFGLEFKYDQSGATTGTIYSSPGYANDAALLKIGVDSGGTNQLVLKGDGNVGIGTTGPSTELQLSKSKAGTLQIDNTNTNTGTAAIAIVSARNDLLDQTSLYAYGSGYSGTLYGINRARLSEIRLDGPTGGMVDTGTSNTPLYFGTGQATPSMTILGSGNVGIGTTGPTGDLSIGYTTGTAPLSYTNGTDEGLVINATRDADPYLGTVDFVAGRSSSAIAGGSQFRFLTQPRSTGNPAVAMLIDMNGNVGIGTTGPSSITRLTVADASDSRFDVRSDTAGHAALRLISNNADYATIDAMSSAYTVAENLVFQPNGGYVGIGTAGPLAKLHVGDTVTDYSTLSFANTGAVISSVSADSNDARSNVLTLMRDGVNAVTYAGAVRFDMSMWESSSVNARTQLDIALAHADTNTLTDVMSLRSNGNVGIGTTAPDSILHLKKAATSVTNLLTLSPDGQTGSRGAGIGIQFEGQPTVQDALFPTGRIYGIWDGNGYGTERLTIQGKNGTDNTLVDIMSFKAGNVGIGTTSPTQGRLVIQGTSATPLVIGRSNGGDELAGFGIDNYAGQTRALGYLGKVSGTNNLAHAFSPDGGTTWNMVIQANGNVGIGTTGPSQKMHVSGGIALFDNVAIGSGADANSGVRIVAPIATTHYNWMIGAQQNVNAAMEFTPSTAVGGTTFSTPVMTILQSGNVGIGTATPSGLLNLKGTLSSALTGTISVTINTATVTGVGTAFTTELAVGDSIKISSEIFTVSAIASATSLTLDSNHTAGASGVTAYRDPTLFAIDNGDAVNKLTVTRSGNVGIGTTTPDFKLHVKGGTQSSVFAANDEATWVVQEVDALSGIASSARGIKFGDYDNTTKGAGIVGISRNATGGRTELGFITSVGNVSYERVRIDENGNIGIGTTGPGAKLDVNTGATGAIAYFRADAGNFMYTGSDSSGQYIEVNGADSAHRKLRIQSYDGTSYYQQLYLDAANQRVYIPAGNVGIGEASPDAPLHIKPTDTSSVQDGILLEDAGTGALEGLFINWQVGDHADIDLARIYLVSATTGGDLRFATNSADTGSPSDRMTILAGGNIGINDTTPDALLDVEPTGAVTATNYAQQINNLVTNTTTDGIDKYGLYISSTGAFTGAVGTATNNYGLYVGTTSGGDNNYDIYAQSGANLTTAGTWTNAPSYRRYKDQYNSTASYLDKLMTLDVYEWQYKNETIDGMNRFKADSNRHASPFLDDFYQTFKLGTDKGFNIQDLAGVAIASVKELNTRFINKNEENENKLNELTLKVNQNYADIQNLKAASQNQSSPVSANQFTTTELIAIQGILGLINQTDSANVNISLTGTLSSKTVEIQSLAIKNTDDEQKTIGEAVITPVTTDANSDSIDDITGSDGKSVVVKTKAVGERSKVFVTASRPSKIGVTFIAPQQEFKIEIDEPATSDLKINWWIVEEK